MLNIFDMSPLAMTLPSQNPIKTAVRLLMKQSSPLASSWFRLGPLPCSLDASNTSRTGVLVDFGFATAR